MYPKPLLIANPFVGSSINSAYIDGATLVLTPNDTGLDKHVIEISKPDLTRVEVRDNTVHIYRLPKPNGKGSVKELDKTTFYGIITGRIKHFISDKLGDVVLIRETVSGSLTGNTAWAEIKQTNYERGKYNYVISRLIATVRVAPRNERFPDPASIYTLLLRSDLARIVDGPNPVMVSVVESKVKVDLSDYNLYDCKAS